MIFARIVSVEARFFSGEVWLRPVESWWKITLWNDVSQVWNYFRKYRNRIWALLFDDGLVMRFSTWVRWRCKMCQVEVRQWKVRFIWRIKRMWLYEEWCLWRWESYHFKIPRKWERGYDSQHQFWSCHGWLSRLAPWQLSIAVQSWCSHRSVEVCTPWLIDEFVSLTIGTSMSLLAWW